MIITNYPMMTAGNQFKCGRGVWSHLFFWSCPSSGQGQVPLCTHSFNVQGSQRGRARTSWCAFLNGLFLPMITRPPYLILHSSLLPFCFFLRRCFITHTIQSLSSAWSEIRILLTRGSLALALAGDKVPSSVHLIQRVS